VLAECQREFNETCEVQTKLAINKANYLPKEDLGGVVLTSLAGRIVCDNTLRARLSYCLQLLLPAIREMLFQESDQYLSERKEEKAKQLKANAGA
jgi:V-type H+-transporting ATPase subunit E